MALEPTTINRAEFNELKTRMEKAEAEIKTLTEARKPRAKNTKTTVAGKQDGPPRHVKRPSLKGGQAREKGKG